MPEDTKRANILLPPIVTNFSDKSTISVLQQNWRLRFPVVLAAETDTRLILQP